MTQKGIGGFGSNAPKKDFRVYKTGKWWSGPRNYICLDGKHYQIDWDTNRSCIASIKEFGTCCSNECTKIGNMVTDFIEEAVIYIKQGSPLPFRG